MFDPFLKAIAWVLAQIYSVVPDLGVSIIVLTLLIMLLLYPLTAKQAKSMIAMQRVQPEIKKLQAKYKNDRQKLNEEMMKFYKENNINPLAGCLPLLLQMPLFIVLYRLIISLTGTAILGATVVGGTPSTPQLAQPKIVQVEFHGGTVKGNVVDKSSVHYQQGGYQSPYHGIEIHLTDRSDIAGAVISGVAKPYPNPGDAPRYGAGPATSDAKWAYVDALAGSRDALAVAQAAGPALGTTTLATATGTPQTAGSIVNKVMSGVIGQAAVWTEPLSWIAAQNFLYQTDAEENEGSGFAFSNAQLGVPWLIVRGISDTPVASPGP